MADLSRCGFTISSLLYNASYCLLHRVISRELYRPGLVKSSIYGDYNLLSPSTKRHRNSEHLAEYICPLFC